MRRPTSNLVLANGLLGGGTTLLAMIKEAARESIDSKDRRQLYVLSCYFDIEALSAFGKTIAKRVAAVGSTVAGFTIAIDAGEWIQSRASVEELRRKIASASGIPARLVRVVPVHVKGRLLHAKAYAVMTASGAKEGFLVVTSGNATERGLGLVKRSNLELATITTTPPSLLAFERLIGELLKHEVSDEDALRQDRFLLALALFSSGAFYHRWQGSLSAEVRFKLTLTEVGKKVRKQNAAAFRGYEPDSDTMSRDPLEIERIFDTIPKPFPPSFWRTYAVDTLLGYWTPRPIAAVVDKKLADESGPYLIEIKRRTDSSKVATLVDQLVRDVKEFSRQRWIAESTDVVESWRKRVKRFRNNTDMIKLRIHPYERVPDVLDGTSRTAVLKVERALTSQLDRKKKLGGTKAVVARFLGGEVTLAELSTEFGRLVETATASLDDHEGTYAR